MTSGYVAYGNGSGLTGSSNLTFDTTNKRLTIGSMFVGNGRYGYDTNTSIGYNTLNSASLTNLYNTAVGYNTLSQAGTGGYNTGIGAAALFNNTTGDSNTAVGYACLTSNTTGIWNTAVGFYCMNSNTTGGLNTAVGFQSLQYNSTGIDNTAIGVGALTVNTAGSFNTAVGFNALALNTTGSENIAVGFDALRLCTTGNYNTALGEYALGDLTTGRSNIGITCANNGRTDTPVFQVVTENNRVVMGHTGITNAYIQVAWTVVSDARDKTNIKPIDQGLDFVNQLNPVSYQFKVSRDVDVPHGHKRYGFLAQEIISLEGNDPVIIDNEDPDRLKYQGESLVPVLVKAIQELKTRLESVEAELATLKGNQNV